jgi:hypothetical protein
MTDIARPSFAGLVRGELIKVRRQRMTWLLALVVVAFVALAVVFDVVGWNQKGIPHQPAAFFPLQLQVMAQSIGWGCGILLLAVSARMVAQDFHNGTVRLFIAHGVGRVQFLLAKLAAVAVVSAVALAAAFLVGAAVTAGVFALLEGGLGDLTTLPAQAWRPAGPGAAAAAIGVGVCALLGFAASGIGRSMVFGLAVALVVLPADNILNQLLTSLGGTVGWLKAVATYQLGFNLNSMAQALGPATGGRSGPVSAAHALFVTGAYAVVLIAAPLVLMRHRDVHE